MKKKKIMDKFLLVSTALLLLILPWMFYLPLKSTLKIEDIIIDFIYFMVSLFALSIYFTFSFLKEEKIKRKSFICILTTIVFYLVFMSFIIQMERFHIIPIEYFLSPAYRAWFTGIIYFAILLFILIFEAEKLKKK